MISSGEVDIEQTGSAPQGFTQHAFDLFVIYAKGDADFVRGYLLPALNLPVHRVQLIHELPLGAVAVSEIDRGVSRSRFTIAVLSPSYLQNHWATFGEQLASYLSVEDARVIPLRLTDVELPLRLEARVSLDFTDQACWESEATRLRQLLHTTAPRDDQVACPYPGMRSFTLGDATRFFGRDSEVNDLIDRLDRGEREIYVIGPSGSGKSSLVQAGLLHKLNTGSSRLQRSFIVCTMRPDERPTGQLVKALDRECVYGRPERTERVLVFIDQLEEMFTLADVTERERFIEMLHVLRGEEWCYLLFALRADFYGAFMESALWPAQGSISRLDVAPLRGQALACTISEPARQVGVYMETRLCDRLVVDAAAEPGALPLMQETLRQLWERRRRRLIGLSEYEYLGGGGNALHVAIARRADATMHALTPGQQTMARRILLRLVSFGEGRPDTRRQQKISTLGSAGDNASEFSCVLQQLVDDRLITVNGNEQAEDALADLSHEAIITAWPALQGLIGRRRVDEQRRRRLDAKVDEWVERGCGAVSLLDAVELSEADQWLKSDAARELGHRLELSSLVAASSNAIESAERQAQGARRLLGMTYLEQGRSLLLDGHPMQALPYFVAARTEGIESPVLRMLFAQAARNLPIATFVGATTFNSDGTRVITSDDRKVRVWDTSLGEPMGPLLNVFGKAHIDAFSSDGLHLVTTCMHLPTAHFWRGQFRPFRDNPWRARIWDTLCGTSVDLSLGNWGTFNAVTFSPDGTLMIVALLDNTAQVHDTATGECVAPPLAHQGAVYAAAFSSDGTRAVTASADNTARVWNVLTGDAVTPPLKHRKGVHAAAFSPDATRVITASWDQTARVWNASTGKPVTPPLEHRGAVKAAAFSPDGRHIVTASADKTARIWDASTGGPISPPLEHEGPVNTAAFSSDGTRVVTASTDKMAYVWDVSTGNPMAAHLEHPAAVTAAAFSPDGARVFTTDAQNIARIWDVSMSMPVSRSLERGAVTAAAFSADGSRVVTARANKTARVWNASTGKPATPPLAHQDVIHAAAFSPDGTLVVTASLDRTARVWDASTGKPVTPPLEHHDEVRAAEFSADGARVVTASLDNTARVWDVSTGGPVTPPLEHQGIVNIAAFSPDGTRVVTASWDRTAKIWDASTGKLTARPLKHLDVVWTAAFNPDGTRVITASSDNTAQVWDASTGKPMAWRLEHQGAVHDAGFSPDGMRIVTASFDNTARVWDASTGKPMARPLEHLDLVFAAAFSPDGMLVVTASRDHTARVWDASTGNPVTPPLKHQGIVRTAAFSPDGTHVVTGCINKTAQLWALVIDTNSLDDWRLLARHCPFVLVDNVLTTNPDPLRVRSPR